MASLIIQDTFEPYYAGREKGGEAASKPRPSSASRQKRSDQDEIVLPEEAPRHVATVRRDRRIVAH
ncbi:hypothetical protein [Mesorhizobium marinum]|uniref:Uncharacterized protein n=1 Tax=Mesorhizobium marinum TaxID=3228790 RepID=A0ABV3R1H9_9HYPH